MTIHLTKMDKRKFIRYRINFEIYLSLHFVVKMDELYAFSYNPREDQLQSDGWDLFSLNNDYLQMGLPTRFWKISRINNEFGEIYKLILVKHSSWQFSPQIL